MDSGMFDAALGGGIERAAVHEVLAEAGHPVAATAFALTLALRSVMPASGVVWIRHQRSVDETGGVYAPGLLDLGLDPQGLTLVTLGRTLEVLRAGIEAARCGAAGAVLIETTDPGRTIDLTATRRLQLAAETSGVTVFILRTTGEATANAARTRWRVRSAPRREGPVPGRPCFDITLLKHRAGIAGLSSHVEWKSDRRSFDTALPRPVAAVPGSRRLAA